MTCPLRPSRGRSERLPQKSITSCSTSSGDAPNPPRYPTGSSAWVVPAWLSVSIRTVSPDWIVSTGARSMGYQPQTRLPGVERTTWSGSASWAANVVAPARATASAAAATRRPGRTSPGRVRSNREDLASMGFSLRSITLRRPGRSLSRTWPASRRRRRAPDGPRKSARSARLTWPTLPALPTERLPLPVHPSGSACRPPSRRVAGDHAAFER